MNRPPVAALLLAGLVVLMSVASAGAASDAPLQSQGPTLRALAIASEFDALHVPSAAGLNPTAGLTIEAWVKRMAFKGCGTIVSKGRADSYSLAICNDRLRFGLGGAALDGQITLPEGRWIHVAATFDGSQAALYVNGVLDRQASLAPAKLVVNASDLVIGADVAFGALFPGWVDEVRLWRVARAAADISANRLLRLPPQAGLIAEWPLDGSGRDLAGGNDGRAGSGQFSVDGRLPRDLQVPLTESAIAVDGKCDALEYGAAERVVAEGTDAPMALIEATANQLYVCLPNMVKTTTANAFLGVYLDRDYSRDPKVFSGDQRYKLTYSGNPVVEEPDNQGVWKSVNLAAGNWEAVRTTSTDRWTVELRISRSLIATPREDDTPQTAGLAIVNAGVKGAGDDYYWPADALGDSPASWAKAEFNDAAGPAPASRFAGLVQRSLPDGTTEAVKGATIQLIAADETSERLVDAAITDGGGAFDLSYGGPTPLRFILRHVTARGLVATSAEVGPRGRTVSPVVLLYDQDQVTRRETIVDNSVRFWTAMAPGAPTTMDARYLIVYGPPVMPEDLAALVAAKEALGFRVEVKSVQDIGRLGAGRDLAEKLHLWLRGLWSAEKEHDVAIYLLLVGRGDVIPPRDIGWLAGDHRTPGTSTYYPAWPTDWYYADVDSDWDADGDGYFGEFLTCEPGTKYWDGEAQRDCPEQGSLLREGPFGELRAGQDDYQAEILVGRLPLNEPAAVRRALATMIAADQDGGAAKRRVALGAGFWSYAGQGWSDERRGPIGGRDPAGDPLIGEAWEDSQPFGHDAAEAFELGLAPALGSGIQDLVKRYETTAPGGDSALSPSRFTIAGALGPQALNAAITAGAGAIFGAGRGATDGLYSANWLNDWDANRQIDQPARPSTCLEQEVAPEHVGPPCEELVGYRFLDGTLNAPGSAPFVGAFGGYTAGQGWSWDGVDGSGHVDNLRFGPGTVATALMALGRVSGWLGFYGPVGPGTLDGFEADVAGRMVRRGQSLGLAHAEAATQLAVSHPYDPRVYGSTLLGDPAAGYWGQEPDAVGAWSEEGGDRMAAGVSRYTGIAVPDIAYTLPTAGLMGPVVLSRRGELVGTTASGAILFYPDGAVRQRGTTGGVIASTARSVALGSSAVALAEGNTLHLFGARLEDRRALALPTGALANGSPRVGLQGTIWVPTQLGLARVAPSGQSELVTRDAVRGAVARRPSGEIVVAATSGLVQGVTQLASGDVSVRQLGGRVFTGPTAPAVGVDGTVFIGSSDGRIYAIPEEGTGWQLQAGGPVSLRPAVTAAGEVFAANTRSEVRAFAVRRGDAVWTARLGVPVTAGPTADLAAVYVTAGNLLYALDRATGLVMWSVALGGTTDERSTPVLGADRRVYVTRADGALVVVRQAGWLAPPSEPTATTSSLGITVRWRDNATEEAGYSVELCTIEQRCILAGNTGPNVSELTTRVLVWPVGTPFVARVQALPRSDAFATAHGSPTIGQVPQSPAALTESPEGSEWVRSALAWLPTDVPVRPTELMAEATGIDSIGVHWRYSGDATELLGFTVKRQISGQWQTVAVLGPEARSYEDTELGVGRRYDYQVSATTEAGSSAVAEIFTSTLRTSLLAVRTLKAKSTMEGVLLQWTDPNRTSTFAPERLAVVVERIDPGSAHWRPLARLAPGSTEFLDRYELLPGRVNYRVRLVDEAGESPTAMTGLVFAPYAPPSPAYMPAAYNVFVRRR